MGQAQLQLVTRGEPVQGAVEAGVTPNQWNQLQATLAAPTFENSSGPVVSSRAAYRKRSHTLRINKTLAHRNVTLAVPFQDQLPTLPNSALMGEMVWTSLSAEAAMPADERKFIVVYTSLTKEDSDTTTAFAQQGSCIRFDILHEFT